MQEKIWKCHLARWQLKGGKGMGLPRFLWINSIKDGTIDSMLFIDDEPAAFVCEEGGYYYGSCYIFDDLKIGVLGARNLNYAKNEMLNKIRKHTQAKINEYKELKSKLKKMG